MILGQQVPGMLMSGWRFVASDAHDISGRIRREFPDARLVAQESTGRLGIVHWFRPPRDDAKRLEREARQPVTGEGGMWLLAYRSPTIDGEPDNRLLEEAKRMDQARHGPFSARRYVEWATRQAEIRERSEAALRRDALGDVAERAFHEHVRRDHGHYNRIWVPRSVSA
jgi:hypothetical protein